MEYLDEKNWIEKSRTLIYAEWSKFDIYELQIFETYLSRINPRDPESSCVRFTRNEYAKMMGYADGRNLKTKTLNKWIKSFINKQISIAYEGGTRHFNLFSDADVHEDPETREIVIDLECNHKLKPVFFDIAKKGYISYRRKNTINFKSEYALKLYCMLKDHAWGTYEWSIDLKELKNMLSANESLYEKFGEFNRRILKKAQDEINGNTDINFSYEKVMRGGITRAVKFKIEKPVLEDPDVPAGQINIYDYQNELPDEEPDEIEIYEDDDPAVKQYKFWSGACDHEFTLNQIKELALLAEPHIHLETLLSDEYQNKMHKYLRVKYVSLENTKIDYSRYGMMKYKVQYNK